MLRTCNCFAQDVEAKLIAFNEAIGKEYEVSNKGKTLIINGFREGKLVKVDKINIYELDFETLKYSEEEQAVIVKCHSDLDGCVSRVLTQDNKKSYRNRLTFGVNGSDSGAEVVEKLNDLLNDMANKY